MRSFESTRELTRNVGSAVLVITERRLSPPSPSTSAKLCMLASLKGQLRLAEEAGAVSSLVSGTVVSVVGCRGSHYSPFHTMHQFALRFLNEQPLPVIPPLLLSSPFPAISPVAVPHSPRDISAPWASEVISTCKQEEDKERGLLDAKAQVDWALHPPSPQQPVASRLLKTPTAGGGSLVSFSPLLFLAVE